jgi:hypothetical protein
MGVLADAATGVLAAAAADGPIEAGPGGDAKAAVASKLHAPREMPSVFISGLASIEGTAETGFGRQTIRAST